MRNLKELLVKNFPYQDFQYAQEKILKAVELKKNVLALMPTGSGKSLCYQFPAKLTENLVLVISPLISLMQDQTQKAKDLGIRATFINSSLGPDEREKRYKQLSEKKFQLLFVTPERFRKSEFIEALIKNKVELLVVDEAHCISLWGHDFRPDYAMISEFSKIIQSPPILALTATATPATQEDILKKLNIQDDVEILLGGIEREELHLHVSEGYEFEDKLELVLQNLDTRNGSQIIYFLLIETLFKFAEELRKRKITFKMYHGDLTSDQRKQNLNHFQKNENVLMLATPAFGLGIDKANIRQIFHVELPGTLESYFQEIGRAGRDRKAAHTFLFYSPNDISISMEFIKWAYPEKNFIISLYQLVTENTAQFQSQGFNFLREQLSFKNKRDYRVESAFQILLRWGCINENGSSLRIPSEKDFELEDQKVLFQYQNKKLLEMYQWAQNTESCRLGLIYNYFGDDYSKCGRCDNCV